jgi:hypothetical protein
LPFDLDEKADLSRAREITLGGHTLKIAPLPLRAIIASTALLPQIAAADSTEKSLGLLVDFVLIGLARTYPGLTRDELLDSETTADELREAADVVILQAGGKKADNAGEAQAASDTTKPIGTSSSPSSASI